MRGNIQLDSVKLVLALNNNVRNCYPFWVDSGWCDIQQNLHHLLLLMLPHFPPPFLPAKLKAKSKRIDDLKIWYDSKISEHTRLSSKEPWTKACDKKGILFLLLSHCSITQLNKLTKLWAPFSARSLHVWSAKRPDATLFSNRFSAKALHR